MLGSVRQRVTLVSHVLLVCMVAVAWYYVLLAGKVPTYFFTFSFGHDSDFFLIRY